MSLIMMYCMHVHRQIFCTNSTTLGAVEQLKGNNSLESESDKWVCSKQCIIFHRRHSEFFFCLSKFPFTSCPSGRAHFLKQDSGRKSKRANLSLHHGARAPGYLRRALGKGHHCGRFPALETLAAFSFVTDGSGRVLPREPGCQQS